MAARKQPSLFITHGGGPCFWMEFPPPFGPHAFDELRDHLVGLISRLPQRPDAIVVISAHWEESVPTISTSATPGMLYDYYGFPEHTYKLQYPAPGSPQVAAKVQSLLQQAGIETQTDAERGFDHGVFVPFLVMDPDARIPVVMLSLRHDLDPAAHIAIGKALEPLRSENILIVGSGNSFHNLRQLMSGDGNDAATIFDKWLKDVVTAPDVAARNQGLIGWDQAPYARICHRRAEHLLPLMVAVGAGGDEIGRCTLTTSLGGKAVSCFAFGDFV